MQNNVTELTQKLLRSLDGNYNVIDMPTVIEIISLLEKVTITKELLETTRLGKHVNELRRNTNNESLAKRAKELVKKWRSMVLPDTNGQLKPSDTNEEKNKKRQTKDKQENIIIKRSRINGQTNELDLSDNSNSSIKDLIKTNEIIKRDIILINSDSNSSQPDTKQEPELEQQLPKKRGRKKGSKNHRNLLDEAETSFTNKMAVSRGNAKVKTTQELVASLQNKNSVSNIQPKQQIDDLNERAAKLTERVSIIDQKLNTNSNRYNKQKKNIKNNLIIENKINETIENDEIIVVDDLEQNETIEVLNVIKSLSVEEALSQLPPIDRNNIIIETNENLVTCSCYLKENKSDFSVDVNEEINETIEKYEFIEDINCKGKIYLNNKYNLGNVTVDRVYKLHGTCIPNVNGNNSIGSIKETIELDVNGLYLNVVPNLSSECLRKCGTDDSDFKCENYKKYNVTDDDNNDDVVVEKIVDCDVDNCKHSNCTDSNSNVTSSEKSDDKQKIFREWHEVVETTSYNGEILKILPYVIID